MGRLRVAFVSVVALALPAMAEVGFKILEEVPAALWEPARPSNSASLVAAEIVDFAEPRFIGVGRGEVRVSVPGADVFRVETLPEMPVVERNYSVPAGAQAQVFWNNAFLFQSPGPVPLHVQPETYYWSNNPNFQLAVPGEGRFYPGKLLDFSQEGNQVRVRFYPVQWDRESNEVLRVQNLAVQVYAAAVDGVAKAATAQGDSLKSESVILTRKAMLSAARTLQAFHRDRYGVTSKVVLVEDLEKDESEIEESELPDGYKAKDLADEIVRPYNAAKDTGYNYSLARKIAAYFQRNLAMGSELKYITLLGDAQSIPPSYYFSVRSGFEAKFGATDQCYAAVEKCLEPRAAVGRLPLQSEIEVQTYLAKVDRWLKYADSSPSELSLFGGKVFAGPFYIGELGALRALSDKADWRGVHKYFRTKQNYDRAAVLNMMRGNGDSSFVYSLDHGEGNKWYVENQSVGSREVQAATSQGAIVNPLIFSISCSNAAYDQKLLIDDLFDDMGQGADSIGVSLLRSVAGAVGYFGSARPAIGAPVFEIDDSGNLDLQDSNHALKLLDTALEGYRVKGGGRLGDYILLALSRYAKDPASNVAKDRFRWTYLNAVLLGDPAMRLPRRASSERVLPLARALDEIQAAFKGMVPMMKLPSSGDAALRFNAKGDVEATLLVQGKGVKVTERIVTKKTFSAGDSDIAFSDSEGRQTYFLRLENKTGVPIERQVWFRTQ